jgi:DNA-directed RNA polymerase subunit RPC12/RpoP
MEKYSAVSCPECQSFKVLRQASSTSIIKEGELVKEATANTSEVYRCQECENEFVIPAMRSGSEEKSE